MDAARKAAGCKVYVLDPDKMLQLSGLDEEFYITDQTGEAVRRLFSMVVERHNAYKTYGSLPEGELSCPVIVFLAGLRRIKDSLDEDGRDKLKLMLEKTSGEFRLSFWAADDYQSSILTARRNGAMETASGWETARRIRYALKCRGGRKSPRVLILRMDIWRARTRAGS